VPPASRKKAQRLLGWAKVRATWADAPSAEEVTAKDDARMLANSDWSTEVEAHSAEIVETLTETYSAAQLAAAYVRLYRERHSAPEDLSPVSSEAPAPREAFGPSTWFSLEGGRATGAEPRRLLPMLCKMGGLSREDIGAIRIQQDVSLIEVRNEAVSVLTQSLGASMLVEDGAVLTQLASPPSLERAPRPAGKPASQKDPYKAPYKEKAPYKDKAPRAATTQDAASPKRDGTTTPVDWNDAPAPRKKKPKPVDAGKSDFGKPEWKKPEGKKPRHKKAEGAKPEGTAPGTTKWKPKAGAGAPDAGVAGKNRKPPAGKPSSKKNRARQAAAVVAKGAAGKVRKPKT
jgi:ATP-dependent RNA helicase DeaD